MKKTYEWIDKEINGRKYFTCGEWYIRQEIRRHNGKCNVYYYVGNDETEYLRGYRAFIPARDFAEKHFDK